MKRVRRPTPRRESAGMSLMLLSRTPGDGSALLGRLGAVPSAVVGRALQLGCVHAWIHFRSTCRAAYALTCTGGAATSPHELDLNDMELKRWISTSEPPLRASLRPKRVCLPAVADTLELKRLHMRFSFASELQTWARSIDPQNPWWTPRDKKGPAVHGDRLRHLHLPNVSNLRVAKAAPHLVSLHVQHARAIDLPVSLLELRVEGCVESSWVEELCAHGCAPHLQKLALRAEISHANLHACLRAMPALEDLRACVLESTRSQACAWCQRRVKGRMNSILHARLRSVSLKTRLEARLERVPADIASTARCSPSLSAKALLGKAGTSAATFARHLNVADACNCNEELYAALALLPTLRELSIFAHEHLPSALLRVLFHSPTPLPLKRLHLHAPGRPRTQDDSRAASAAFTAASAAVAASAASTAASAAVAASAEFGAADKSLKPETVGRAGASRAAVRHSLESCLGLRDLEVLKISQDADISDPRVLMENNAGTRLALSPASGLSFASQAQLTKLASLSLTSARLENAQLQQLRKLDLSSPHTSPAQPIQSLPKLMRLRALNFSGAHLRAGLMRRLRAYFPALASLHVPVCAPEALEWLREFKLLEELNLASCASTISMEELSTKRRYEWCALPCVQLSALALPLLRTLEGAEHILCVSCAKIPIVDALEDLAFEHDSPGELHCTLLRMLMNVRPEFLWDSDQYLLSIPPSCAC